MRSQPADGLGLRRKLQITQIAVRWADITNKDGVVEVENHGNTGAKNPALKDWRPQKSGFAENINGIILVNRAQHLHSPSERAGNEPQFLKQVPSSVKHRV